MINIKKFVIFYYIYKQYPDEKFSYAFYQNPWDEKYVFTITFG